MVTARQLLILLIVLGLSANEVSGQWSGDPSINTPVCTAPGEQQWVRCVNDGAGGAIFAWKDSRDNGSIYTQHIDVAGVAQWTPDGVRVATYVDPYYEPTLVSDGRGGAIITFATVGLKAQRIDQSGLQRWGESGISMLPLLLAPSIVRCVSVSDDAGGVIAALYQRDGFTYNNFVAIQKADSDGVRSWGELGIRIASGTFTNPIYHDIDLERDALGASVVVWTCPGQTRAQRVRPNGSIAWGTAGALVCNAGGSQLRPKIVSDGEGGTILAWIDRRDPEAKLFAVRLDSSGTPHIGWPVNGAQVCDTVISYSDPSIDADGACGAFIAFCVPQSGQTDRTYVQHLSGSGALLWGARGVSVSSSTTVGMPSVIVNDGAGGVIVAWQDRRLGINDNIFAQRINASGVCVWPDSGVLVCGASGQQSGVCMTGTIGNGAIIGWRDMRGGTGFDIYAQRVTGYGALPVQLASFTAHAMNNNQVRLEWRTISEINNYGFFVQRKRANQTSWVQINEAIIPGYGTTNEPHDYSYVDYSVASGEWQYSLKQVDLDGTGHVSGSINVSMVTSAMDVATIGFALQQNYPNPFNPTTEIKFSVEMSGHASLRVYDMLGREVATLFDEIAEAGWDYKMRFDASGIAGGVYFYRLQTEGFTNVKKLMVLK